MAIIIVYLTGGLAPGNIRDLFRALVIITGRSPKKRVILMCCQNQTASPILMVSQAAAVCCVVPVNRPTARGRKSARMHMHTSYRFAFYTISNSHLLFHERCNALMRAYYLSK